MTPPLDVPELFTVQDGAAAGLTPRLLRSPRLVTPIRGVRAVTTQPLGFWAKCRAAALQLPDDAGFSHVTAIRLLGIDVPWRLADETMLHVTTRTRSTRPQNARLVSHHSTQNDPGDFLDVDGMPVVRPAFVWLQLARTLPLEDVVTLGDSMLRRKAPAATLADLHRTVAAGRKLKGLSAARTALDYLREGTDSVMESRCRFLLVANGLPCPRVNDPVYDGYGILVAMPDMAYRQQRVAIEYDGDIHRTDPATWRRDIHRKQALEALGWRVIICTADDIIRTPGRFVTRVRQALTW